MSCRIYISALLTCIIFKKYKLTHLAWIQQVQLFGKKKKQKSRLLHFQSSDGFQLLKMLREMLKEFFFLIVFIFRFSGCNVLDFDDWSADDNALFPTIPIAAPWSEDEQCRRDSRLLMTHLKNKTYWAVQSKFCENLML